MSVRTLPKIRLEKNSYLQKYYSQGPETLPQYRVYIASPWKNTGYTLKNEFVCMDFTKKSD